MEVRLGEILVDQGVLCREQIARVLDEQERSGEPFGLVCERLFSVDPSIIEDAWASQYARLTRTIDPFAEPFDRAALELVTRRQAWQFRVLPIRFDERELMVATSHRHLRRALRFATNVIGVPIYLVLADSDALGRALCLHYALPGMTPGSVDDDGLDRLLNGTTEAPLPHVA